MATSYSPTAQHELILESIFYIFGPFLFRHADYNRVESPNEETLEDYDMLSDHARPGVSDQQSEQTSSNGREHCSCVRK